MDEDVTLALLDALLDVYQVQLQPAQKLALARRTSCGRIATLNLLLGQIASLPPLPMGKTVGALLVLAEAHCTAWSEWRSQRLPTVLESTSTPTRKAA